MSPAQRLVARVDEILKTTTKFRNAQEWASKAKLSRSFLSTLKSREFLLGTLDYGRRLGYECSP